MEIQLLSYENAKKQYQMESAAGHLLAAATWLLVMREIKEDETDGNN